MKKLAIASLEIETSDMSFTFFFFLISKEKYIKMKEETPN